MKPRTLDVRNRTILTDRMSALDTIPGPRCGDFVVFSDGVTRRISHVWEWEGQSASLQTSDGGSYYLGDGFVSFSGSLYLSIDGSTLTLTDEKRPGSAWFFWDDCMQADNGVDVTPLFRVYKSSVEATR